MPHAWLSGGSGGTGIQCREDPLKHAPPPRYGRGACLVDENPLLLRLKELEALEKVTEKVDKLTVFGGLDGVLKEMVRINV